MNKVILISVQPEWVQKILQGKKTIEVRKTMPKCELPVDVYIYCTQGHGLVIENNTPQLYRMDYLNRKSQFVKKLTTNGLLMLPRLNGKVVGKFTLNKVEQYSYDVDFMNEDEKMYYITCGQLGNTCLTYEKLKDYGKEKTLYGWHIENLVIFDEPMELSEFTSYEILPKEKATQDKNLCISCQITDYIAETGDIDFDCKKSKCDETYIDYVDYIKSIIRPPQSWQYVYFGGVD